MGEIIKRHHISFKNAFAGIKYAVLTQPNFRIHLTLTLIAILLGCVYHLSRIEWIVLIFTIFWGLGAEMVNTSLESMTDLITSEWRKEAKIAKDVAAGMMLLTAVGALFVALWLFLPKIFSPS